MVYHSIPISLNQNIWKEQDMIQLFFLHITKGSCLKLHFFFIIIVQFNQCLIFVVSLYFICRFTFCSKFFKFCRMKILAISTFFSFYLVVTLTNYEEVKLRESQMNVNVLFVLTNTQSDRTNYYHHYYANTIASHTWRKLRIKPFLNGQWFKYIHNYALFSRHSKQQK